MSPYLRVNITEILSPHSISQHKRLACLKVVLSVALKNDMHQLYNLKVDFKKGDYCSFFSSNDHNALLTSSKEVTYPYDVALKSSKWLVSGQPWFLSCIVWYSFFLENFQERTNWEHLEVTSTFNDEA